jgi:hypothetical protein
MATIIGTAGNDRVSPAGSSAGVIGGPATAGDDIISGLAGNDTLEGGDGNDALAGGADSDRLLGGNGSDYIVDGSVAGDPSADYLDGGDGDDEIHTTGGADTIVGGAGLYDSLRFDYVSGVVMDLRSNNLGQLAALSGIEIFYTTDFNDYLVFGNNIATKITIYDGKGDDVLGGGGGDDSLISSDFFGPPNDGNDSLYGFGGNDYIYSGVGDDRLFGGDGNDTFSESSGTNIIDGGAGRDVLDFGSLGVGLSFTLTKTSHNTWTVAGMSFSTPFVDDLIDMEAVTITNSLGRFSTTTTYTLKQVTSNFNTAGLSGFAVFPSDDSKTSDFLLRDAAGGVLNLRMQNSTADTAAQIGNAAGWTVVATGDFNADGGADILMRNSANAVVSWTIKQGQYTASSLISSDSTGYRIVGTGDLNDNGTQDVLLQNGSLILAWMMAHNGTATGQLIGTAAGYTADAAADINGDGATDIVMHDAAGNLVAWLMNASGQVATGVYLGNLAGYTVTGAADFNGDGTTDLLLKQTSSGYMVDLIMGNGAITAAHALLPSTGFTQVGVGDYNGDGTADVAWQSGATLAIWNITNGVYSSTSVASSTLAGYSIFG